MMDNEKGKASERAPSIQQYVDEGGVSGGIGYEPLLPPFKADDTSGGTTPRGLGDGVQAKCVGCLARCWCCYKTRNSGSCGLAVIQVIILFLCVGQIAFMIGMGEKAVGASTKLQQALQEAHILYDVTCSAVKQLQIMGISNVTTCPG